MNIINVVIRLRLLSAVVNIINPGPRCNNLWSAITTRDIALWLRARVCCPFNLHDLP